MPTVRLKVACVVKIKLFLNGLVLLNLIILFKQNPIQKFRQSFIVFEKPSILSDNLKTLTSSNYSTLQCFFAETSHTFLTYQCLQKGVRDFLFVCLDPELFAKIKDLVSTHSLFTLINNSKSKENKNKTAYLP